MAVNKVEVGAETVLDLTEDTVSEDTLLPGVTAHNSAGERIAGAANAVLYTAQSPTTAEKTQARTNIGAAASSHNHNSLYYQKAEVDTTPKPNLFINPLFQIWQRYPSGYSGVPVNHYVCDGWRILSSDGSKTNNLTPATPYGMANAAGGANCTITQFLENAAQFNGLQMTCSVLKILANGSQTFVTATKTASGWTDSTDILAFFGTSSAWRWIGAGETFVGAKLEVGTRQTFAYKNTDGSYTLNEIPDRGTELLRCQRRLVKIVKDTRYRAVQVTSNKIYFAVPIPTTMRGSPAFSTTNLMVFSAGTTQATGFTFSIEKAADNALIIAATKANHGLSDAFLYASADTIVTADL